MALQRMPCSRYSAEIERANCSTAPLVMQYALSRAKPFSPPIDDVITMLPLPLFSIPGSTALQVTKADRVLIAIKLSYSSSVVS
ncbi:hypothetical protein D3C87_1962480 [compost metagenome]